MDSGFGHSAAVVGSGAVFALGSFWIQWGRSFGGWLRGNSLPQSFPNQWGSHGWRSSARGRCGAGGGRVGAESVGIDCGGPVDSGGSYGGDQRADRFGQSAREARCCCKNTVRAGEGVVRPKRPRCHRHPGTGCGRRRIGQDPGRISGGWHCGAAGHSSGQGFAGSGAEGLGRCRCKIGNLGAAQGRVGAG